MKNKKSHKQRKPTITQEITKQVIEKLNSEVKHDLSRKSYIRNSINFVRYCRQMFNVKSFEECKNHIQDYSDYLQLHPAGYTASTIHTYLSAACKTWDVPLNTIDKPIRRTSEYIRGRTPPENPTASNDLYDEKWRYLTDFQRRCPIRRNELYNLKKGDFGYDKNGMYVFVRKGKGNKKFKCLILDEDAAFIKSYFDETKPDEYVFDRALFRNDLNLHKIRSDASKKLYSNILDRLRNEPGFREKAIQQIKERWEETNINKHTGKPKRFNPQLISGYYYLRGANRRSALQCKLPLKYDKVALMYISVFFLSHFRNDVTLHSYILA